MIGSGSFSNPACCQHFPGSSLLFFGYRGKGSPPTHLHLPSLGMHRGSNTLDTGLPLTLPADTQLTQAEDVCAVARTAAETGSRGITGTNHLSRKLLDR